MTQTEKGIASASAEEHHSHHRHRVPRSFVLPDGRRIHIAVSPEEVAEHRRRLEAESPSPIPFDVVLYGSDDHKHALHQAHSHQEERRQELRQRHGEAFDEFEKVRSELEELARDLHNITEHAVSLDANFSKFGYSAHLRTYDEGAASHLSSDHDSTHETKDWEAERHNVNTIRFWKRPTIRQYFHKGLLWRASNSAEVSCFELFVDLLYVGIIAINGDHAAEEPVGLTLLHFCITFAMSWRIWSDLTTFISWLETDDVIQRMSILFILTCLFGFTTNVNTAFDETYSQLIAFYLTARLFMACYLAGVAWVVPMVRDWMIGQVVMIVIPTAFWIGSIYLDMPLRLVLIALALAIDSSGQFVPMSLVKVGRRMGKRWAESTFEFYPAMNIEHKTERTNAFVALVFGYTVVACLYQNVDHFGINAFFGKAVLGLLQAFALNWLYFEVDGQNLFVHAIRRSAYSAFLWVICHLPFVMAYVLSSSALSRLVLAHDCADANEEQLAEAYAEKSEGELSSGLRWFYCAGLAIALASMGGISLCHVHKESQGVRLTKLARLLQRFLVCVVMLCLPLADGLNSLELVSLMTGLIYFTLIIEVWGVSCPKESFFCWRSECNYEAKCKLMRRDIEAARQSGRSVTIEDIARNEKYQGTKTIS